MLVTLAVVGVLAAVAVPGFTNAIRGARVVSATNQLEDSIVQGQSWARHLRQTIILQRRACPRNDWGCGWIMYPDTNGNNLQDPAETTIRVFEVPPVVRITKNGNVNQLVISRLGQAPGVIATTFSVGLHGTTFSDCRSLVVSNGMRLTINTGPAFCPS